MASISKDTKLDIWGILDQEIKRPPLQTIRPIHTYPSEASVVVSDPVTGGTKVLGSCLRANYFRHWNMAIRNGVSELEPWSTTEHSTTQLWKFLFGDIVEAAITEEAKLAGIYITNSKKFFVPELNLSGELDLVILDPFANTLVGIEIKSIYGYYGETTVLGSPSMRKRGLKGMAKDDHILQTAIYTWHWRHQINYFVILYISRGSAVREQFYITVDPIEGTDDFSILVDGVALDYTINDVLNRYAVTNQYVESGILPDRDFELQYSKAYIALLAKHGKLNATDMKKFNAGHKVKKGDWRCSYCNYSKNCYDSKGLPIMDNNTNNNIKEEKDNTKPCLENSDK